MATTIIAAYAATSDSTGRKRKSSSKSNNCQRPEG